MVRSLAVAALILLAGCLGPSARTGDGAGDEALDMSFFESCPAEGPYVVPCEANATNPFFVEVADSWPAEWLCMTFVDQRFPGAEPWPDWYTLFGPAIPDGAGGLEFQMGFAYDAHNDTDRIGGIIKLLSEDREELFTFEGPSRGFVRIPAHIQGPKLAYVGILFPATVGWTSEQYDFPDDFYDPNVTAPANLLNITGLDAQRTQTHWSIGPYRGPVDAPVVGQFDVVRNVDAEGTQYHFPAWSKNPGQIVDRTDDQGVANWGMGRGHPYNTTVRHGPVQVEGTLQPYMAFGAKFEDVYNPVYTAMVHYQCGCFGTPITTVEGLLCFLGMEPPIVAREAASFAVTIPRPGAA